MLWKKIAVILLLASVFAFRWFQADPHCESLVLGQATVKGYVSEMPDEQHENTKLTVTTDAFGKILVTVLTYPKFSYGDKVEMTGTVKSPSIAGQLLYAKYLESQGICSVMFQPKIKKLPGSRGNIFWKWMYAVKESLTFHLEQLFPEPSASFAGGLLIGDRKGLPPDVTNDFRRAGISHIIALSGFNITILFSFIIFLLERFSKRLQFFVSVSSIVWFTLLTGAAPSIVRAAIMGFLWFLARIVGRPSKAIRALFISAAIMLFFNPRLIFFDPGFQLSFFATFGLIMLGEKIERWFSWLPWRIIREPLVQTLSATIPTLPILIFYFGQISFIAPISNVAILPLIPFAMLISGIPLFLDYFSHPLALIVAFWGNLLLIFILKLAAWFSALPFASWKF